MVRVFDFYDAHTGEILFKLYLDLFYREGKQGGAFAYPVIEAGRLADGSYQRPTISVVANFLPPEIVTEEVFERRQGTSVITTTTRITGPALLRPDNVRTLFHESGHEFHMGLTRAEYYSFAGSNVPMDWVEVPSQLLEHWRLDPEVRKMISSHHETGQPLPQEMVDSLKAVSTFGAGRFVQRQVFYAVFDQLLNGPKTPKDVQALWDAVSQIILGHTDPQGTARAATFHHLMSHYKGGYCSYMLSETASDFIHAWVQALIQKTPGLTLLHPFVGEKLTRYIYAPGHERPISELLNDLLSGEPVTPDPFLTDKGIPLDQDPAKIQAEIEKTMKRLGGISGCEYLLD